MASWIREMFSSSKEDPVYRVNYAQRHSMMNPRFKQPLHGPLPAIELQVPMCCDKCTEKVHEELRDMDGVRDVLCDQFNQRVTVTGYADPLRVLKRVKKVKKKSEFFTQGISCIDHRSAAMAPVQYTAQPLVRTNSFGRSLARQPSFGKVAHHGYDPGFVVEARDVQRDYYYGVRRMPSFKKHRYHDAEYVSMGDQFTPQYTETRYIQQQPHVLQSQVSFSKLPVRNLYNYVKPMYHEY